MMSFDCSPRCCLTQMKDIALLTFTFLFISTFAEATSECRTLIGGGDLIIRCQVLAEFDLSAKPLDVTRPDLKHLGKDVVHAYRHRQDYLPDQMDQYKGRTTLNHEDLKKGIVTLRISSVEPSDSGRYRIFVPRLFARYITVDHQNHQNLTKTDNSSTSGPPVEDRTETDSDAEEMTGRNVGVGIGVVAFAAAAAVVVVVILVKLGKIKIRKKRLSGPTGQEAELKSNGPEKETLTTSATDDSHGSAENGLMVSLV